MSSPDVRAAWHGDWDPLIAMIGEDLFRQPDHRRWGTPYGDIIWGPDRIDRSALRRYLEPLEFECPLHDNPLAARAECFDDLVVPATALLTFAFPPIWTPGAPPAFTSAGRDDPPDASGGGNAACFPVVPPHYSGYFGTDFELDVIRPAVVGDRVGRHGSKLLAVLPKKTQVGRGAFLRWEEEIVDSERLPIARVRVQMYVYEPRHAQEDR